MNNDFEKIFRYMIVDTEVLYDYFSFQWKTESMEYTKIIECYTDQDCIKLYNNLKLIDRPMYVYSLDFDAIIINALCKLVEQNKTDILLKLRQLTNHLIRNNIDFENLNRDFWTKCYFPLKEENPKLSHNKVSKLALEKLLEMYTSFNYKNFLNGYAFLLGKSRVVKNLTINSIPKILKYTAMDKNGKVKMTISLKKLQLIKEGKNIKFDFNKYEYIRDIKKDGFYEEWIKYSKNDVSFLEELFLETPKSDILKRWYAYLAVLKINPGFEIDITKDLFSENNTNFICRVLEIENPNKNIDIDYTKYIKTDEPKFNKFVDYVNQNKQYSDKKIKENYKGLYFNENNFDMLKYNEIKLGKMIAVISLGGAHGAIPNYKGENLIHLDYTSLYPSIILQFKELFKNILNVALYEAIYNMRNKTIKPKLKTLDKNSDEYKLLKNIESGIKLILNSSYGLINSLFNIPIACKSLGRFICLFGQSLLINLTKKILIYDSNAEINNFNTDGIIIKTFKDMKPIIKEDRNGYFTLGVDVVDMLIQKDVNNYIKIIDGKVKTKGAFNLSIKQHINKHERISVNTLNALNLLDNKSVEIKPIYFDTKWIDKEDKAYYFTSPKNGKVAIKLTKTKQLLEIGYETYYFTDDKNKADIKLYEKYANIVKNSILNFSFIKAKVSGNKPIPNQISMF